MAFDINEFSKSFTQLERVRGSDNSYFVVAKKGESKLALHFEPALFGVPYNGKVTPARGLVMRGILLSADGEGFTDLRERPLGYRQYKNKDDAKITGTPLFRHLIPLTTETSSSTDFHNFAETAFAKLFDWLADKVKTDGGEMVVSKDDFMIECGNVLVPIETTVPDLFHLPGEMPDWAKPKLQKLEGPKDQPAGEDDNDASDDDSEED